MADGCGPGQKAFCRVELLAEVRAWEELIEIESEILTMHEAGS